MKKNDVLKNGLNLQPARDSKGKRIENALVRLPQPKDNSKFPSQLGAVYHAKDRRRLRGLWYHLPAGPFVAQFGSALPVRINLSTKTLKQAIDEQQEVKFQHRDGKLTTPKRTPGFSEYAYEYMQNIRCERKKRPSTIASECLKVTWWINVLGNIPLSKITLKIVKDHHRRLRSTGPKGHPLSDRTMNYYLTGINNVLNQAVEDKVINANPITAKSVWQKLKKVERPLFTYEEKERLVSAAIKHCPRNGRQLADFINLLCFCGARIGVALRLRWVDVDWDRRQLIIARDGSAKNGESRRIEFNPDLEKHLHDMYGRREQDNWLFSSAQRGQTGKRAKSFQSALKKAREKAGLGVTRKEQLGNPVTFHDFRHFFCSMCVMEGIDFKTIADWVGHTDGGILIGSTYSHLSDEHKRRAADNLSLTPNIIDGMTKWGLIVGISGLIVAGLYYFLKQEMSVGLIDESGHTSVISFKRSVIEGQKLGQEQAAYASSIIQWACDNSRRSSHG